MYAGKIFVIGFNKTGTTSLHKALQLLGYKSIHYRDDQRRNIKNIIDQNLKEGKQILHSLDQYDAISDWHPRDDWQLFADLDEQYPKSKFILLIRDLESWLKSRENHIKCAIANKGYSDWEINREMWTKDWHEHQTVIRKHFIMRQNDLLEMNIIAGDGWEKLAPYLGHEIPQVAFPCSNKTQRQGGSYSSSWTRQTFCVKILKNLKRRLLRRING